MLLNNYSQIPTFYNNIIRVLNISCCAYMRIFGCGAIDTVKLKH
jgi:hypothetical protein